MLTEWLEVLRHSGDHKKPGSGAGSMLQVTGWVKDYLG